MRVHVAPRKRGKGKHVGWRCHRGGSRGGTWVEVGVVAGWSRDRREERGGEEKKETPDSDTNSWPKMGLISFKEVQ